MKAIKKAFAIFMCAYTLFSCMQVFAGATSEKTFKNCSEEFNSRLTGELFTQSEEVELTYVEWLPLLTKAFSDAKWSGLSSVTVSSMENDYTETETHTGSELDGIKENPDEYIDSFLFSATEIHILYVKTDMDISNEGIEKYAKVDEFCAVAYNDDGSISFFIGLSYNAEIGSDYISKMIMAAQYDFNNRGCFEKYNYAFMNVTQDGSTTEAEATALSYIHEYDSEVAAIKIEALPETEWLYGDEVSLDGIKVIAEYSDETELDVTADITVDNFDAESKGAKTATVKYIAEDGSEFTAKFSYNVKKLDMPIQKPTQTVINYGDSIILHANLGSEIPEGAEIVWEASNDNFSMEPSADGMTCKVTPVSNGETTFTVKVVNSDGDVISEESNVTMTAKASFFQKLIAFFKKLFGTTKVIPQAFEAVFNDCIL